MAENRQGENSFIEDLGVLSATGIAGTALFFRSQDPYKLNEFILKSGLYMSELKNIWFENKNNITNITTARLDEALRTANRKFLDITDAGTSFRLSHTNSISRIVESYNALINKKETIRTFYQNEAASIALKKLNSFNISNPAIKAALSDQIQTIARTPGDFIQIKASLQGRLDYDDYLSAIDYAKQMSQDVNQWIKENPLDGSWGQVHGEAKLNSYVNVLRSTPQQMWEEQLRRKESLTGRAIRFLQGDSSTVTIKEMFDVLENGTDEQKSFIKKLLKNSTTINASSELLSSVLDTDNKALYQVTKESLISGGTSGVGDIEILREYYNSLDDQGKRYFGELEISGLLKDKKGRYYTLDDTREALLKSVKAIGQYSPLSFFHIPEMAFMAQDRRQWLLMNVGDSDFASAQEILGQKDSQRIGNMILYTGDDIAVLEGDSFNLKENLKGQFEIHNKRVGATARTNATFAGVNNELYLKDSSSILGMNVRKYNPSIEFGNNASLYGTFTKENVDKLKYALNIISKTGQASEEEMYQAIGIYNGLKRYVNFLTKRTTTIDLVQAKKIAANLGSEAQTSKDILNLIIDLNENPGNLESVMNRLAKIGSLKSRSNFNAFLNMTIQSYIRNPEAIKQRLNTRSDPFGTKEGRYVTRDYIESLTGELVDEFSARYAYENGNGYSGLFRLFDASLDESEAREAKSTAAAYKYKELLNFPGLKAEDDTDRVINEFTKNVQGFENFVNSTDEDSQLIKAQLTYLKRRFNYDFEIEGRDARKYYSENISKDGLIRKAGSLISSPKDIIKEVNEGHYNKAIGMTAQSIYDSIAQFWAGRDSTNRYTKYSAIGGHLTSRLNDMLKGIDRPWMLPFGFKTFNIDLNLSLTGQDTASSGAIFKNLLLKRVAPVVATYKILEVADDVTDALFGMGIYESGMSGVANIDLAFRKATDAIGLTGALNNFLKDNAIAEYFSGYGDNKPGFYSYEEEKDYWQNGYTAIRKARFWDFGSSNEYRGGRISYWEPNTLRLISSDYKDESLYNGEFWTKYSPWQLLDPYYLEHLHYEDRPYPVSGSMFADSTPWGIVLNSTIGEIFKPKVRMHTDRLQNGIDVKALIYHMNTQVRNQANNNLFYMEMGRLKSMAFDAYNAPTYSERIVTIDNEGNIAAANDYGAYSDSLAISGETYSKLYNSLETGQPPELTLADKINIAAARGNIAAKFVSMGTRQAVLNIIKQNNDLIMAKAGYSKSQGVMREEKLNSYDPIEQLLNDSDTVAELLQAGSANDYVQQMAISARMLGGIYGWMGSNITGYGQNNYERIATSDNMYSFSRRFWDSGVGGFGGDLMEIVRRVIPEYRRYQTINPLMNTMPDWLPARFRMGDPYTSVPNGEARMPGKGYESLNQLHPDIYGRYGAFDRFKILADIAPYSPEYKFWKKVAQKTIKDPYLKEEMDEIRARVAEQSRQHDFAPYKYVGRDVERRNVVITEVLANGQFKIFGSDTTFKLAGVRVKPNEQESGQEVLNRYITPGTKATIVYDTNEAYARNKDTANSVNAAIVLGGESIGQMMLDNNDAIIRKNDVSAASYMANHGTLVNTINYLSEAFMHADIPVLHNRWFRANDALEDYLDDYLYGASFQSWDDFWGTFIIPNMRKAASSSFWTGLGITTDIIYNNLMAGKTTKYNLLSDLFNDTVPLRKLLNMAPEATLSSMGQGTILNWSKEINKFSSRGALMGHLIAKTARFGQSGQDSFAETGRRVGNAITLAYSAIVAPENLAVSMMSWSRLGYMASEYLEGKHSGKLALAGAAIGLARWAGTIKMLNGEDERAEVYIPDSVRKRWDMQEYFDRLTYIKYMALYEKAAELAESEEDTDIKSMIEAQDKEYRQIRDTKKEIEEILKDIGTPTTIEEQELIENLKHRLNNLSPTRIPLSGGDYTKSAIMYYNAARSTMYALDETSSLADVVRALPKTERDYYMEFVKEKDAEKRKEILSYVSPSLRKALRMMWYGDYEKPESNESYFTEHYLPAPTWGGWNPNVDLADIQAKVVKNEGMIASDFGIYNSQYREPEVINAPDISNWNSGESYIISALNIQAILSGAGLIGTEVNVEPQQDSTIQVIANIARVVEYDIEQNIRNLFGVL